VISRMTYEGLFVCTISFDFCVKKSKKIVEPNWTQFLFPAVQAEVTLTTNRTRGESDF
jgi:hypothetical protein